MKNALRFLREVREELRRVQWPTRGETLRYTVLVVAISVAMAAYLGALDFVFSSLLRRVIGA